METADKARQIRLFVLDVDGVMTDGRIIIDDQGVESKTFNVKDGMGVKLLMRAGIEVAILSARDSMALRKRALELGIQEIYLGVEDKGSAIRDLIRDKALQKAQVGCIGDDLQDIPMFRRAGLSIAVADAAHEVRAAADLATARKGGEGAVREACEYILKAQDKWDDVVAVFTEPYIVPEQKLSFSPISASASNFSPQNTQSIPAVKIFIFPDPDEKSRFSFGHQISFAL